jgi:aminobenzoyl-glutamate utilization protein B
MIKQTFGAQARQVTEMLKGSLLATQILPAVKNEAHMSGSTDVGDVSWVTPTGQFTTTCGAFGTPGHSWQLAAQSGMGIGYAGMFFAGKILAAAAIEFMQKPELVKQAREEFELKLKETPYVSPIPDGAKAPIGRDDD